MARRRRDAYYETPVVREITARIKFALIIPIAGFVRSLRRRSLTHTPQFPRSWIRRSVCLVLYTTADPQSRKIEAGKRRFNES